MMTRIKTWLYGIKADKFLHFIGGMAVSQLAFALLRIAMPLWLSVMLALVSVAVVGGVKEAVDIKYGVPSMKDFYATMYGGFLGVLLAIFVAL